MIVQAPINFQKAPINFQKAIQEYLNLVRRNKQPCTN